MTTVIESRPAPIQTRPDKDPIGFLVAYGLLEPRGMLAGRLREILAPYLPRTDELNHAAFLEARERIGKALKPGETLSQLIVKMREE